MSPKSTARKLLVKANTKLWISHPDRLELLGGLPEGAERVDRPKGADVAVFFIDDAAALGKALADYGAQLGDQSAIWFAYRKGNRADINRDTLWPVVAEHGLKPVTQVAIDGIWSALRFRPLAAGEKQFSGGRPKASKGEGQRRQ